MAKDSGNSYAHRVGMSPIMTTIICDIEYRGICLQCFDAVGWAAGRASGL